MHVEMRAGIHCSIQRRDQNQSRSTRKSSKDSTLVEVSSIEDAVRRKEIEAPAVFRRSHEICEIQTRDIVCRNCCVFDMKM